MKQTCFKNLGCEFVPEEGVPAISCVIKNNHSFVSGYVLSYFVSLAVLSLYLPRIARR